MKDVQRIRQPSSLVVPKTNSTLKIEWFMYHMLHVEQIVRIHLIELKIFVCRLNFGRYMRELTFIDICVGVGAILAQWTIRRPIFKIFKPF